MLPRLAIPSYRREDVLLTHTLSFLSSQEYPPENIFIFVADEEEKRRYQSRLPAGSYSSLLVGRKGLREQRKVISEWAEEGEVLVQMDDDVRGIKFLDPQMTFKRLLELGIREVQPKGGLFGILPNDDTRRFKASTTYHLTHILGSFFLCTNHRSLETTTSDKEDYERSILYYLKYGRVIRYRGAGVSTSYNVGTGGLICEGRSLRMKAEVEMLVAKYPALCSSIQKKSLPDLSLNWRHVYIPSEGVASPPESQS